MLPKLSVITPSYNQAQFLEETIVSVLAQNYSNLEYIVIDGGSTDKSTEIIKRYEKQITFWVSEKDSGQSEAINKGFRKATGEIVTWLNSDDVYMPNALQTVAGYFNTADVALVHGKAILFGDGFKDEIRGASEHDLKIQYLAKMPFNQPSSFFRRRVLLDQGYLDETLHYMMDYDLLLRIVLNYEIRSVPETFSKYRLHQGCKTLSGATLHAEAAAQVFSKLLRSFDCAESFITDMKELGLYVEGVDRYQVTKPFTKDELRRGFLYFLDSQAHYYYDDLNLAKTTALTNFVKQFDLDFYRARNLNQIFWRSKLLSRNAVKLLRTFTR